MSNSNKSSADQAQRIADLETKCVTLKKLHDAAADERDALAQQHRSQHDADSAELRQLCADQVWRIADLEVKCVTLKELHDAATDERDALRVKVSDLERAAVKRREISDGVEAELVDECDTLRTLKSKAESERDELRAKYDELLVALHGIGTALGIPEGDRSPYSVTCGVLERVNRLAEIEAQEPVADDDIRFLDCPLYARPVPAQAVPDADGARFRWLCEDHSDRETRERCRSLIGEMIAAALAEARREGAEQMRATVESALDDLPLPDGFFVSDIMGAINDALPLPTGERQAVLLTDAEVRQIGDATLYAGGIYDRVRAIETAVLAANGLEVRRG